MVPASIGCPVMRRQIRPDRDIMSPQSTTPEPAESAETGSLGQESARGNAVDCAAGLPIGDVCLYWSFIVEWLLAKFRWLSRQDAEDLAQVILTYIWKKKVPVTEANVIPILIKVGKREAINLWRKRKAGIRGGGEAHVSLDEVGDVASDKGRTSAVLEGIEAVDEVLREFSATLNEREKICFDIRIAWLPFDPELDVVYAELTGEQRVIMLPARCKDAVDPERKILVKAQITRSMSAVKARIADYLNGDSDDDGEDDD